MKKRRFHIILATTLFAALLWVSVNLGHQYQTTLSAQLLVRNIPPGKAIMTPVPKMLQLRFRGDGWRLAALVMGGNLQCALDLTDHPETKKAFTLNDVAEQLNLPFGVQPLDMKPDSLFIALDEYAERTVPILLRKTFSFREGYGLVGDPVLLPESVSVGGAASVVRNVTSWKTVDGRLDKLKAPVEADIPLADPSAYALTLSPSSVRLRLDVQPFAEKVFPGISVEVLFVPANREVILIPPKIEVVLRSGIEQLSVVTPANIRATVPFSVVLSDTSGYVDFTIETPGGLQVVNRRPDRLQYIIRKRL